MYTGLTMLSLGVFASLVCSHPLPISVRDTASTSTSALPSDSVTRLNPAVRGDTSATSGGRRQSSGSGIATGVTHPQQSGGGGPNEPPGFQKITERSFSSKEEGGWTDRGDRRFRIAQDPTAPHSPPDIGEASYSRGFRAGSAPINTYFDPDPKYRKLYISFWMKMSQNWFGNESGVNKVLFVWIHENPSVVLTAFGQAHRPLLARIGLQGLSRGNRNLLPNGRAAEIHRGQWTHWEAVLEANTPGAANGVARWWVNGVQVGNYTDIMYSTPRQAGVWGRISWNPTYGGRAGQVPDDQFMWFDHIYVSGQP